MAPRRASLWDALPAELQIMVLEAAGPLTRAINGRSDPFDPCAVRAAWLEALASNWPGDLSMLPDPNPADLTDCDIANLVVCRTLYERLAARFPSATESNGAFAEADVKFNRRFGSARQTDAVAPDLPVGDPSRPPFRLLHVAMRQMWVDLIGASVDQFPYARAYDAIALGHQQLLRHLVDESKVDPSRLVLMQFSSSLYPAIGTNKPAQNSPAWLHVLDVAAMLGNFDSLVLLHGLGCVSISKLALEQAAANGHLSVVMWIWETFPALRTLANALDKAAATGQLSVIQWLHSVGAACTTAALDNASAFGHIHVVRFLHENRFEGCTTEAMDGAATGGHILVVQFLHFHRREGCTVKAMDGAARYGHLDVVQFLHFHRREGCTTKAMDNAAWSGHLHVVEFLHLNRTEGCTHRAIENAAYWGHLKTVQFLHANRTEGCTTEAMDEAASHNHLHVVKWLHHNRSEGCTSNAMNLAAQHGNLDVVKWLHENRNEGCTPYAIGAAAASGHLNVVKFLLESGRSECTLASIANASTPEIARVLVESLTQDRHDKIMEIAKRKNQRTVMDRLNAYAPANPS